MYCSNCGTELSDDANFCLKCGKPQKPDIQADEIKWETCEIVFEIVSSGWLGKTRMRFWADAIGQEGSYNAGDSIPFEQHVPPPESNDQLAVIAHRDFVGQLVADGWEATGDRGNTWWSHKFRRKVVARLKEEKDFVNLVILSAGRSKIETIKVIRKLTNLGLGEAKTLAETSNGVVLRRVSRSTALQAQSLFAKAGAATKIV